MAQKVKQRIVSNELTDKDLIVLEEKDELQLDSVEEHEKEGLVDEHAYKWSDIVWRNVVLLGLLHIAAAYAWHLFMIDETIKWQTSVATFVFGLFSSSLGITAGAHRLWSHRSYKAKWPLRFVFSYTLIDFFI